MEGDGQGGAGTGSGAGVGRGEGGHDEAMARHAYSLAEEGTRGSSTDPLSIKPGTVR